MNTAGPFVVPFITGRVAGKMGTSGFRRKSDDWRLEGAGGADYSPIGGRPDFYFSPRHDQAGPARSGTSSAVNTPSGSTDVTRSSRLAWSAFLSSLR